MLDLYIRRARQANGLRAKAEACAKLAHGAAAMRGRAADARGFAREALAAVEDAAALERAADRVLP